VQISTGFSSGSHSYACYENGARWDSGTVSIASGGSANLPCYNGNIYAVYATIDGVASNTVHPDPNWP
jgi:hypothetical protein